MRILIAEDDPISRRLLQASMVKWGYEVIVAENGDEALAVLESGDSPHIAILDWMMPGLTGPEICEKARKLPKGEFFYLLLLTSKSQKDDIVAGLEAGADDYLIKPFNSRELHCRVQSGSRIVQLQDDLLIAQDALEHQANYDGLTEVLNRAAIFNALRKEIARAKRMTQNVSVVMADLDHFKQVNDTYGHVCGDVVLKEVALRLQSQLRGYDYIGRYGGEEFLLILPDAEPADAFREANRQRDYIARQPISTDDGGVPLTLSMGVASLSDCVVQDVEHLIRLADEALYLAKENGRNRVELVLTEEKIGEAG